MHSSVDALMRQAVQDGIFPSAELLITKAKAVTCHAHYGAAKAGSLFDLASLTKPICTATIAAKLIAAGKLSMDAALADCWSHAQQYPIGRATIRELLEHRSGLPAWKPYYRDIPADKVGTPSARDQLIDACLREPLISAPGAQTLYSDIGFILLGRALEHVANASLTNLFQQYVAAPLQLRDTRFLPLGSEAACAAASRCLPTETCAWRGRTVCAAVHDHNCFAMGGVAGHAGLFGTAFDLHLFAARWMQQCRSKPEQVLIDWNRREHETGQVFLGGWDTPTPGRSSAGKYFSRHTVGHLGYTGCSLWMDLDREMCVILLSNRVHPDAANDRIRAFRPLLHDAIMQDHAP